MKILSITYFLFFTVFVFSQELITEKFTSEKQAIEINTQGLDEIIITTSNDDFFTIELFDENPNAHHVIIDDKTFVLKIGFELESFPQDEVFKKFITKRLQRASAKIALPKDKILSVIGTTIDVISKSYDGNLMIAIDKGLIKLGDLQANADVKLFQGNVYAMVSDTSLDILSNKGTIQLDTISFEKKLKRETTSDFKKFELHSIHANVFLKTVR